jgi:hypothetical protein
MAHNRLLTQPEEQAPTAYDSGTVLEPKLWHGSKEMAPADRAGRVDFDDDEQATIVTGLRVLPKKSGGYTLEFATGEDITVVNHSEGEGSVTVAPSGNIRVSWQTSTIEHHSVVVSLTAHPDLLGILEGNDSDISAEDWAVDFEGSETNKATEVIEREVTSWGVAR